ncbi:LysM peptidoglycan-binding domain-containing protein [Pseudomonas capeferrum]|uniref:FimV/HubP family polar landmark protein n=1 Tax=Pseudomonas capeferrum TaxID=1495066 RepID=UPI0015E440E3|nr:FimV/HubP family polar landmark protein [Pseudomonas capeferrum]MBA1202177.1 LysM peptidoglycan-binding domain-containing protein [Pseudomonas capeferrum]
MLRIRKLVLAIATASALSSGMANALGLGELTLRSAQGEPLDAEIELLDVRDLTAAEVAPSLAPPEEFVRAGVALPPYLEDLTFTPVIIPNGKSVLRVTSSAPLPGPVVKFLVQVMWPQGRLLRDYSVPLDQAKAQGAQPGTGIAPAVSNAGTYTTQRRDTLWQIAARHSQGGSVQQTMVAIQALNPDAFIGNNINQLKVGEVLRLPDQQQIQSIPQGEAVTEVAEQYAAWRAGRRLGPRARQLDATRRSTADSAPAQIAQPDNLRLVAPSTQAEAGNAKAVSDQLAVAQESLDTTRRDNEELKSRLADLQSQLDKLQRLIELKNDQLARLQAQDPDAAVAATLPGEPAIGQPLPAAPLATAEPVIDPAPAAVDTAPQDAAQTPPVIVPDAAPADVGAAQEKSVLDELLGSPLLLWLIAGSTFLVLLLLLLILARKRKAQQEAEKHLRMARALAEEGEPDLSLDVPLGGFDELDTPSTSVKLSPAVVAASAAAAVAAERAQAPAPVVAPPVVQDDSEKVLLEAEIAIAQGRYNHAAELLEPAVAAEPQRSDLRLKLMEVNALQGDRDSFTAQERQLQANGANATEVAALKERFPAMLGVAAAGVGAAALAAELDEQYVQKLLDEQQEQLAADESSAEPVDDPFDALDFPSDFASPQDDELEGAFDLSLADNAQVEPAPAVAPQPAPVPDATTPIDPPVIAAAEPVVAEDDADADFEALLAQAQAEAQAPDGLDDFDLDVGEPSAQESVRETPVDVEEELAAFDAEPDFAPISDDPLSEDFDLSLSLDDETPADKRFASELDEVNSELDTLSQNFGSAPAEPRFDELDAVKAAESEPVPEPEPQDDLDFDFFSGADEVTTKLDLARAYIDMGDHQGARDILDEVVKDGDDTQREEAQDMLSRLV